MFCLASTTSKVGVSNASPLSPTGNEGQVSIGLVVVLDAIKGFADQVFANQFVNQVSTSIHILPLYLMQKNMLFLSSEGIGFSKTHSVNLRNWRKIMCRLLRSLEGHVNRPLNVSKKPLK